MAIKKLSQTDVCIDRYCKSKERLEDILAYNNQLGKNSGPQAVRQAEEELEKAFANLLYSRPVDLPEVINKSRLFIGDILSDADLTQYQILALQCIIDDLSALLTELSEYG